jgi:hypothetical protein
MCNLRSRLRLTTNGIDRWSPRAHTLACSQATMPTNSTMYRWDVAPAVVVIVVGRSRALDATPLFLFIINGGLRGVVVEVVIVAIVVLFVGAVFVVCRVPRKNRRELVGTKPIVLKQGDLVPQEILELRSTYGDVRSIVA